MKLEYFDVLSRQDMEGAFQRAVKGRADAVLALGNSVLNAHRTQVADLAVKSRLPAMYYAAEFVDAGGLMFYGVDFVDLFRRAAIYVDKILKGAKPGELPVEQPKKFEFIINLKAAKQIGLTIPQKVLARGGSGDSMKVVSSEWSLVSLTLSAMLGALCSLPNAQQQTKIPRLGVLISGRPSLASRRIWTFHLPVLDWALNSSSVITSLAIISLAKASEQPERQAQSAKQSDTVLESDVLSK